MNDKFLMHFDPKQESGRRVPAALAALAAAGKATTQYVLLVEVDASVAEAARIILAAQGVEIEPWPVLMERPSEVRNRDMAQKTTERAVRACIICGKEFQPKRHDQVLCGNPECKKARQRWYLTGRTVEIVEEQAAPADPFAGEIPEYIWMPKDRPGLGPLTGRELLQFLEDRTIAVGTILLRRDSIFQWEVYETRPGVLGVREVASPERTETIR